MADIDLSAFGFAPADTPAPAGPTASPAGPKPFADGLGGELPDGSATRDPAVWTRWLSQYQPAPASDNLDLTQHGFVPAQDGDPVPGGLPTPPTREVGTASRLSNIAAGGNDAIAGALGLPVDLMTGGINLATRGVNAVAGTDIPAITEPVGGSGTFRRLMGLIGANPDEVQPEDGLDRVLRSGAAGAVSAAVPAGGAALAVRTGLASVPAADAALNALGRFNVPNVGIGTAAGIGGDQAAQAVPDQYRPLANVLGGLIVGGGAALAHAGVNALSRYAQPIQAGSAGSLLGLGSRPNALLDLAGTPMRDSAGAPISVTPGQAQLAGRMIEERATDPQAVRSALADGPAEMVPGSQPTTFQATRDPGLGQLERGVSRDGGPGSAAFASRSDAQNDAQVAAVRTIAPDANVQALPQQAQSQAAGINAAGQAAIQDARGGAGQALNAMRGDLPPGSEAQVGQALRAPAAATDAAARARERALWEAIDPDGTLAVDMAPVKARAQDIMRDIGPMAAPPTGEESAILQAAAGAPSVSPFRDLKDLRSRLTTAIAAARIDPAQAQTVRRLSMMLDGVHGAMEGGFEGKIASDAAAVRAGTMAPEQTMMAQLQAQVNEFQSKRQQAVGAGGDPSARYPTDSGSGSSGIPGSNRTAGEVGWQPGNPAGNPSLQGQEPLTPNFDAEAQARYAEARAATADRRGGFDTAPGVKAILQGGPQSGTFRMPDASVPSAVFRAGANGADHVTTYLAKGGSSQAVEDAAAFSLRQAAMRDGVLDPGKYASWAQRYSSALSALPEARGRFDTAAAAQQAVEAAEGRHADATRAFQASAAGKFLGNADPVTQVATILRGKTAQADMANLAGLTAGNPDARAGLQRAVADFILRDLKGDQATVTGEETRLRAAQLQSVVRKATPALREIMSETQIKTLQAVVDDLQRSSLSASGTRVGAGSDTVQNAGAVTLGSALMRESKSAAMAGPGVVVASAGGYAAGGVLGAALGGILGTAPLAARAMSAARAAGLKTVDDLVREAMLQPGLAQVLLAKVTPANQASVTRALIGALGRLSTVPPMGSDGKRQAPAGLGFKPNALLPAAMSSGARPPENALLRLGGR